MCSAIEYRELSDSKVMYTGSMKDGVDGGLCGAHQNEVRTVYLLHMIGRVFLSESPAGLIDSCTSLK
jgi:hypothetical protein